MKNDLHVIPGIRLTTHVNSPFLSDKLQVFVGEKKRNSSLARGEKSMFTVKYNKNNHHQSLTPINLRMVKKKNSAHPCHFKAHLVAFVNVVLSL